MKKHSCIVAFHIGHSTINEREAKIENICNTCCGGVMLLNHCPICGKKIKNKDKYQMWQDGHRVREVKERISDLELRDNKSNFMNAVLDSYKKELKELNDVKRDK